MTYLTLCSRLTPSPGGVLFAKWITFLYYLSDFGNTLYFVLFGGSFLQEGRKKFYIPWMSIYIKVGTEIILKIAASLNHRPLFRI